MTKVTYIHGIPEDELQDRAKEVPEQRYIDAGGMTSGELTLALLREQAQLLASYYPERGDIRQAETLLTNVLNEGLHNISYIPGNDNPEIRRAIYRAKRRNRPAVGIITRKRGVGLGGLIPTVDCRDYMEMDRNEYGEIEYFDTSASRECEARNREIQVLNQHLEPVSHHLLYEYLNQQAPNIVTTKSVLHRNAVSSLSELFDLDRDNMALWLRNGVMRNNAANGTEPYNPEITIRILAEEVPVMEARTRGGADSDGLRGAFLAALPAILQALGGALAAAGTLLAVMKAQKAQQLQNTAQGIGTRTFGPEESDWSGFGNGGTGNDAGGGPLNTGALLQNENLPLILGGLGAVLLLSR